MKLAEASGILVASISYLSMAACAWATTYVPLTLSLHGKPVEEVIVVILDIKEWSERTADFNESASYNNSSARFSGCRNLIDLPVGTARGNHSYGGVCSLKGSNRRVMVCNDELVGHFMFIDVEDVPPSVQMMAEFVGNNCYGG